jgi:hypothetical protein
MNEILENLERLLTGLGRERDFTPLGSFGERHGSWEAVYWRGGVGDVLDRFVCVAVTENASVLDFDLRVGAEQQARYVRRTSEEFSMDRNEPLQEVETRLGGAFTRALAEAERLESADLAASYLFTGFGAAAASAD